ncbi:MAG: hypothetical protein HQK79_06150 [Desulfobacterales bacterium]|nr:hypothetical protein [Desulfobacterales bacterium]
MKKEPIIVNIPELEDILEKYLDSSNKLNYAIKISGYPGIGKSAIVKQVAQKKNFHFIDTRLAFKENIDLGGYPIPSHELKQMIYYRPKFIPPEIVPENYKGIVWFLDESNRAHPTVIQTLFQIITEKKCGDHSLPEKTAIILAGNLGEEDNTTITEFDDSALDGRLAIFYLKPDVENWLIWANNNNIHSSIIQYISLFPDKLWDKENINPNPRGWHQVSNAITKSYGLSSEDELFNYFKENPKSSIVSLISSLVGVICCNDFIMQITCARELTTQEIINGNPEKLEKMIKEEISSEDILWAISGAFSYLKEKNIIKKGAFSEEDLIELSNILKFIGYARSDISLSFFYLLIKSCGIFTLSIEAIKTISDETMKMYLINRFGTFLDDE